MKKGVRGGDVGGEGTEPAPLQGAEQGWVWGREGAGREEQGGQVGRVKVLVPVTTCLHETAQWKKSQMFPFLFSNIKKIPADSNVNSQKKYKEWTFIMELQIWNDI